MNFTNLLRLWQWLSATSLAAAVTVIAPFFDRKLALLPLLSDGETGGGAIVNGAIFCGLLVLLQAVVGTEIVRSRLYLSRRQRFPELFGFTVVVGQPFESVVPIVSWILFSAVPAFVLAFCAKVLWTGRSVAYLTPGSSTSFSADDYSSILHGGFQAVLIMALMPAAIFFFIRFHVYMVPPRKNGVRGWFDHVAAELSFPFGWPWSEPQERDIVP